MSDLISSLINWNIILVIIVGCSVLGVAIFIERLLYFRRAEFDTASFLVQIRSSIEAGNIIDAVGLCERTRGAISNIVKAGLLKHTQEHSRGRSEAEGAMEVRGTIEIANLEKNARILSILAHVTPLVGLLGTVLGFIQAFSEMRQTGLMDISTSGIGGAMEYALVTTAAGLAVAIPAIVAYNYLVSRVSGLVLEMQTTSSEVIDLLQEHAV